MFNFLQGGRMNRFIQLGSLAVLTIAWISTRADEYQAIMCVSRCPTEISAQTGMCCGVYGDGWYSTGCVEDASTCQANPSAHDQIWCHPTIVPPAIGAFSSTC